MGALADAALDHGCKVIGVIPRSLSGIEVAHQNLTRLVLVETMHERKALMAKEADAFVALPGGFGTLDEFFEILTWAQLGIHAKPCVLINTAGYYDHLLSFLQVAIDQGFLKQKNHTLINVVPNSAEALKVIQNLWENLPISHKAPAKPAP
jgi:uncharacterized protein (TIGR00730 family)